MMGIELWHWYTMAAAFAAGALLCAVAIKFRMRRTRRADAKDQRAAPQFPGARWLSADQSPTGRRVLDCRAAAMSVQLVLPETDAADQFCAMVSSDGSELAGTTPSESWLVDVDWTFDRDEADELESGMFPQVSEDMWRIDCIGSRIYFRRSWTGNLVLMCNFTRVPTDTARITRLWISGKKPFGAQSPEYMVAYVRHVIDTHLLNVATPFPIPPDFPDDKQKIAALVIYSMGRRGWLAEYFEHTDRSLLSD